MMKQHGCLFSSYQSNVYLLVMCFRPVVIFVVYGIVPLNLTDVCWW